MLSKIVKKVAVWFSALLAYIALTIKDWENFFPLHSHSDLRFQSIGESLENLALVGIFALARLLFPRVERSSVFIDPTGRQYSPGQSVRCFYSSFFWRDYFPNDAFKFGEALKDVRLVIARRHQLCSSR